MIELRGISWDHPRGHDCVVAVSEAYMAANPQVRISWETRSLEAFGDMPIDRLAGTYDLLVIDHPFVGFAAATGCLLPLDQYLDAATLDEQATNSVGPSFHSYSYAGHQWALAIDAAAQVAAYRPDLIDRLGGLPQTWDEVLRLAQTRSHQPTAQVAIPLTPVNALMCFCSICATAGEDPFATAERMISREVGRYALATLRSLRDACHSQSLTWNPPQALDQMSTSDEIAYIPLLFGYANYARPGFRPRLIRFADAPRDGTRHCRTILGGAGLAVSSRTAHPAAASGFAAYVAQADVQRTTYFEAGGQPGHRAAWLDDAVNAASSNFFRDTLATLDNAYLRPRYNGYPAMQDRAGEVVYAHLTADSDSDSALDTLDSLYRESKRPAMR